MSQTEKILNHLLRGRSITPLEALNRFGCFRLGARIWEIRKTIKPLGYKVRSELVKTANGKHVAEYKII